MNKVKIGLIFTAMIATILIFLYHIVNNSDQANNNRIQNVEENFKYSRGVIIEIHSYKGHSIKVKYSIDGTNYIYCGGWDNNTKKLNVNDSIFFKYSVTDPGLIITELEKEYRVN